MAYDERLAARIRKKLSGHKGITEQKMFGGLCFLLNGHMCCGVVGERMVLRLGDEGTVVALRRKHATPMDFTGKPLKSMVFVDPAGLLTKKLLDDWVGRAAAFTSNLPKKPPKKKHSRKKTSRKQSRSTTRR